MPRTLMLLVVVLAAGCLVRSASEPRFFWPESAMLEETSDGDTLPLVSAGPLRLRSVESRSFLRERIVWRTSPVEYGFYEQRRWRELPATYVGRALVAALQRTPGVRLSDDLRVPSLRAEVIAFDEVLAPAHVAAVSVAVSVQDKDRHSLLAHVFTAEMPIGDGDPVTTARAMGHALDEVTSRIAVAVTAAVPHAHAGDGTPSPRRSPRPPRPRPSAG